MKSKRKIEPVFYGIKIKKNFPLSAIEQRSFYRMLFIHPNLTIEKVKNRLNDSWYIYHSKMLTDNMNKEIDELISTYNNPGTKNIVEKQIVEKIRLWIKEFSLPSPEDISEMATVLKLSEVSLNKGIYSLYKTGLFPADSIIDYLMKYTPILSEKLIDNLLETYISINTKRNLPFKRFLSKAAAF